MEFGEKRPVISVPSSQSLHGSLQETGSSPLPLHSDLIPGKEAVARQDALPRGLTVRQIERLAPPAKFVDKTAEGSETKRSKSTTRHGPTRRQFIGGALGVLGLVGLRTDLPSRVFSAIATPNLGSPEPSQASSETSSLVENPLAKIPENSHDAIFGSGDNRWTIFWQSGSENAVNDSTEPTVNTNFQTVTTDVLAPVAEKKTDIGGKTYEYAVAAPAGRSGVVSVSVDGKEATYALQKESDNPLGGYKHVKAEQPLENLTSAWKGAIDFAENFAKWIDQVHPLPGVTTEVLISTLPTESQIITDPKNDSVRSVVVPADVIKGQYGEEASEYLLVRALYASLHDERERFDALFSANITRPEQIVAEGGIVENGIIKQYPAYLEGLRIKTGAFRNGQASTEGSFTPIQDASELFAYMWLSASSQLHYTELRNWYLNARQEGKINLLPYSQFRGASDALITSLDASDIDARLPYLNQADGAVITDPDSAKTQPVERPLGSGPSMDLK